MSEATGECVQVATDAEMTDSQRRAASQRRGQAPVNAKMLLDAAAPIYEARGDFRRQHAVEALDEIATVILFQAGSVLKRIREDKLYKEGRLKNWTDYCKKKLDLSPSAADKLIALSDRWRLVTKGEHQDDHQG